MNATETPIQKCENNIIKLMSMDAGELNSLASRKILEVGLDTPDMTSSSTVECLDESYLNNLR